MHSRASALDWLAQSKTCRASARSALATELAVLYNATRGMKEAYIAAKERWARKMAGQAGLRTRSTGRLPPGQRQVHNFPVLDLGVRPEVPLDKWQLKIHGDVENPV